MGQVAMLQARWVMVSQGRWRSGFSITLLVRWWDDKKGGGWDDEGAWGCERQQGCFWPHGLHPGIHQAVLDGGM
jgi:hypothetical protein